MARKNRMDVLLHGVYCLQRWVGVGILQKSHSIPRSFCLLDYHNIYIIYIWYHLVITSKNIILLYFVFQITYNIVVLIFNCNIGNRALPSEHDRQIVCYSLPKCPGWRTIKHMKTKHLLVLCMPWEKPIGYTKMGFICYD